MEKIKELRAKAEELIAKMRAMLDAADAEKRDLTEEETALYAGHEKEADKVQRDIERLEKLEAADAKLRGADDKPYKVSFRKAPKDTPKEWRSADDFLYAACFNRDDPRLQDCQYREMSMGTGTEGGFAIPEQFKPEILQVTPAQALFRPRSRVIPAGDPPDAKITMPALDQTSAQNVYGGVVVSKVAEGGPKPETNARLKEVSLEPGEVAAYVTLTDKLLRNWTAASNVISSLLRGAIIGWEDTQLYNGNGIGGPLGVLKAPCRIEVSRNTANQIVDDDIRAMMARIKMGGSYLWVASQTTLPYLMNLNDGASHNVFMTDFSKPIPNTLIGIPLMFHDRSVALGTTGDLILVDMNYYLIKDGSGPFVASDGGIVNFTSNKTIIKAFWNVDGKPWLTEALPLEGSTANTVSPFVVLKSA